MLTPIVLLFVVASRSQSPIQIEVPPSVSHSHEFVRISRVRELASKRLIVVDELEKRIALVDFATQSYTVLGREGRGPGEYRWPSAPQAFAGDTTIVLDQSSQRYLFVNPDGKLSSSTRTIREMGFFESNGRPPYSFDGQGRLYGEIALIRSLSSGRSQLTDSVRVVRLRNHGEVPETLVTLATSSDPGRMLVHGQVASRSTMVRPFVSRDQWAVFDDGSIAIAHLSPYSVEIRSAGGTSKSGPIHVPAIAVSEQHKRQWRLMATSPRVAINYTKSKDDFVSTVGSFRDPLTEPSSWPKTLPPFLKNAVWASPNRRFWVQRTTEGSSFLLFDVFDSAAKVVAHVALPNASRLVGVGRSFVYTVRVDTDDVEHLQRHDLSRFPALTR